MNIKEIKCATTANKCCKNYRALKIPIHSNKIIISLISAKDISSSFSQYFSPIRLWLRSLDWIVPSPDIYTLKPFVVV